MKPLAPVAFLASRCVMQDSPERHADHREYLTELAALQGPCREAGIDLRPVRWNSDWDPEAFAAVVIGTTWDYAQCRPEFMQRLLEVETTTPLFNPSATVAWNADKTYLRELQEKGAPSVPTLWPERATPEVIAASFEELGCDEIVVKPRIGAGAWRQARIKRDMPLPTEADLPPSTCLIQPFLPGVRMGEYSFVFIDGDFSHCSRKIPAKNDYRVQAIYGASSQAHSPSKAELGLAHSVLGCLADPLLYARVDMLQGLDGELALMELEVIEPYLYPEEGPNLGPLFASALRRRL